MTSSDFSKHAQTHSPRPRVRLVRTDLANPFPEYRPIGLVGQGQFAQVHCAVHKQTGQLVAIKQTRHTPEHPSQEPLILGELCHSNLVCCQAIAQTNAGYQFVLDYCEAGTLRTYLEMNAQSAVLSPQRLTHIALDVLKGLRYIHSEQVIHGDLKPENILLTYQAQSVDQKSSQLVARIGDFGSARFSELPSQSRKEIGSPTYAAPERFEGQSSQVSDLYSAGVVLYELFFGERPFSGSPDYLRQAHQTQSIPFSNSVHLSVQSFFRRALHKLPKNRFDSADKMIDALEELCLSGAIAALDRQSIYLDGDQLSVQPIEKEYGQIAFEDRPHSKLQTSLNPLKTELPLLIHQLVPINRTCFGVTDNAVYSIDVERELRPVVHLQTPSQVAVSPDESWLLVLPKKARQPYDRVKREVSGRLVYLRSTANAKGDRGIRSDRVISFQEQLPTHYHSIQTVAIDRRHILRVSASMQANKSYIECFTRKGKRVVAFALNVSLSHATPSYEPYQLIATSATDTFKDSSVLLISLRPFQVRSVLLSPKDICSHLRGISAFPWGFSAIDDGGCLFLDRSACPVGRLNMPGIRAIAPLPDDKALIALSPQAASAEVSQADSRSTVYTRDDSLEKAPLSNESSALFVIDLRELDLDLVF